MENESYIEIYLLLPFISLEEFCSTTFAVIFPETYPSHANHFQLSHQTDVLQVLKMRSQMFSL